MNFHSKQPNMLDVGCWMFIPTSSFLYSILFHSFVLWSYLWFAIVSMSWILIPLLLPNKLILPVQELAILFLRLTLRIIGSGIQRRQTRRNKRTLESCTLLTWAPHTLHFWVVFLFSYLVSIFLNLHSLLLVKLSDFIQDLLLWRHCHSWWVLLFFKLLVLHSMLWVVKLYCDACFLLLFV